MIDVETLEKWIEDAAIGMSAEKPKGWIDVEDLRKLVDFMEAKV